MDYYYLEQQVDYKWSCNFNCMAVAFGGTASPWLHRLPPGPYMNYLTSASGSSPPDGAVC